MPVRSCATQIFLRKDTNVQPRPSTSPCPSIHTLALNCSTKNKNKKKFMHPFNVKLYYLTSPSNYPNLFTNLFFLLLTQQTNYTALVSPPPLPLLFLVALFPFHPSTFVVVAFSPFFENATAHIDWIAAPHPPSSMNSKLINQRIILFFLPMLPSPLPE